MVIISYILCSDRDSFRLNFIHRCIVNYFLCKLYASEEVLEVLIGGFGKFRIKEKKDIDLRDSVLTAKMWII